MYSPKDPIPYFPCVSTSPRSLSRDLPTEWNRNYTVSKDKLVAVIGSDDQISSLMCPICDTLPIPPVHLCQTGHLFCGFCRQKMQVCDICSSNFCETRNLLYERWLASVIFACIYKREGCEISLTGGELKKHQQFCEYRPLPCFKYGCENMKEGNYVPYSKFLEHFKSHGGQVICSNGGIVRNGDEAEGRYSDGGVPVANWTRVAYKYEGNIFFVNCQLRGSEIGIWLWIFGNEVDANKFSVKISLKRGNYHLFWEGPVNSIRKSEKEIMDIGQCLMTSIRAISVFRKKYLTSDIRWDVNFTISENENRNISPSYSFLDSDTDTIVFDKNNNNSDIEEELSTTVEVEETE